MRYLLPDPASSPAWRAQRHKSTPVSSTPACPHCYLDKAQFGLLTPVLKATRFRVLPVNFKDAVMSHISQLSALRSLFNHTTFPAVSSLCHGTVQVRANAAQHLNHCLNVLCGLLFSPVTPIPPCSTLQWSPES